ncbi:hypothetical protein [Micromonospora sp. ATCC 39149]|uniref:Transposase n=1 Tax=Micromonospora carbonacea TaxID=47853 RepID=A0A7D5YC08_9ACTN|nr:hypothetical protein [Micromonospora sp. ATCC 39149]QLJ96235.1 hypothetical protein HZU44_24725 [Micromonospora carbonacea]
MAPGYGRQVRLLSAYDTSTGVVLAQVQIAAKSNEIPAFTPLLRLVATQLGLLTDILVVADALQRPDRTRRAARRRRRASDGRGKANQPKLFAQLKAIPWAQVPAGDQTRDIGHGRKETRTVKAITIHTPGGLGFPTHSKPSGSPGPARSGAEPLAKRCT